MIKLAGVFALWEIAKLFMGPGWMKENIKRPEIGGVVAMFELPYMAWGVWLLFSHPIPATALWGFGFAQVVIRFRLPDWDDITGRINCALSAILLAMVFFGRVS